jgi:hypothetical protein
MEDPMTIRARTRQVNVPAYYLGRPADLWISLTSSSRRRRNASSDRGPRTRETSC